MSMASHTPRNLHCVTTRYLADTLTPVSVYLKLRDRFPRSYLLESSDSRAAENSWSFVCCDPVYSISVDRGVVHEDLTGGARMSRPVSELSGGLAAYLDDLLGEVTLVPSHMDPRAARLPLTFGRGLFGHFTYDSVCYFEDLAFRELAIPRLPVPDLRFSIFRYVIAISHFKNEMYLIESHPEGAPADSRERDDLLHALAGPHVPSFPFEPVGSERGHFSDEDFLRYLARCHEHIKRGDIFQIVPSRRFEQDFTGDEFNVYRALRSINPSPYLFFFDGGNYKIFGSSPEAQIVIRKGEAEIHPIAGTYPRSGDDTLDQQRANDLKADPKENAEHAMLVDLARNDLSRSCTGVKVAVFREVHFYSHVIHLVSKVTGKMANEREPVKLFGDTFPAGTLSGAPKYRAMQIIDEHEPVARQFYGGAIGFIGFDGSATLAIVIRSFMSSGHTLSFQSGFGFVFDSVPESELAEANHKVGALRKAIQEAKTV